MTYIDRNLLSDEQIVFRTKKSLIIFFYPVVWTIICLFIIPYMHHSPFLIKLELAPWILALILWVCYGIEYLTSEFAVTNKRVMMREGFFIRHANEMRLSAISQVNVEQSLLGQLLNYGIVYINAFGVSDSYPLIAKPFWFQRTVNEQLDKVSSSR